MSHSDAPTDPFLEAARSGGAKADAIAPLRARAADAYAAAGLPTRRVERWKFTDLNRLRKLGFSGSPVVEPAVVPENALAVEGVRLTLVNGRVCAALSDLDTLPEGVRVRSLAAALADGDAALADRLSVDAGVTDAPLAALNTAALEDGWLIDVAEGAMVETPLHLIFIAANEGAEQAAACHPRLALTLGANASATVIESHVGLGAGPTFSNSVSEIALSRGARLGHYVLQDETDAAFHIASSALRLDESAVYDGFVLQLGAALARRELRVELAGPRADCRLDGAYLGHDAQVLDNTLFVDHAAPETVSRETFKGVLDDKARGVFQAKTLVRPEAQRTDGRQLHKALLLSDGAEVDAKPELEIYADDVACSHGATAGDLDHDQLFYLRARGIPEATARGLLIEAFLTEHVQAVAHAGARAALAAALAAKLKAVEGVGA
ncbi:MAG: Fe-S cluster assembly protein SufD [Alphaproteobacteria bacterium]|nr:Fe-S cluster assembly protein SufD [Alphaproteobacteria bacterium]